MPRRTVVTGLGAAVLVAAALLAVFDTPTAVFLLVAVCIVALCGAAAVGFGVVTRRREGGGPPAPDPRETVLVRPSDRRAP